MRRFFVLFVLVSLGSGATFEAYANADTTTTTSTPSTTTTTLVTRTTVAKKQVWLAPLTGRPDPTRSTKRRSALTIKIENTPEARPQYGIEKADVVYEEICEGGITRLAAIFNSNLPTKVGPVRSVRRTD